MNMCLKMLFTLSLSGTALILVLLGATRIFGSHMGRRWQYYIWLAAVLRLLLPIPSPAGLIFPDALSSGMSAGLLSDGGNLSYLYFEIGGLSVFILSVLQIVVK